MIADPRWFKTITFNTNECIHQSYVGRVLATIFCNIGVFDPADAAAFIAASKLRIYKAGKLVLTVPVKALVNSGPGGMKLPVPIKITATTKVSIETTKDVNLKAPIVVSLGGDFLE